jgi:hypothetical protein
MQLCQSYIFLSVYICIFLYICTHSSVYTNTDFIILYGWCAACSAVVNCSPPSSLIASSSCTPKRVDTLSRVLCWNDQKAKAPASSQKSFHSKMQQTFIAVPASAAPCSISVAALCAAVPPLPMLAGWIFSWSSCLKSFLEACNSDGACTTTFARHSISALTAHQTMIWWCPDEAQL